MRWRILALVAVAVAGCREADSVVVVQVETVGVSAAIHQLRATLNNAGAQDVRLFPDRPATAPLVFPTGFALVLARSRSGDLRVQVDGMDAGGRVVATGEVSAALDVGRRTEMTVVLRPPGQPQDGGADGAPEAGDGPSAELGGEGADRAEASDGGAEGADGSDAAADVVDDKPIDLAEAPGEPPPEPPPIDLPPDAPPDLSPDFPADLPVDLAPEPPADMSVDAPMDALLGKGASCTVSTQCASGHCVNNVCCTSACNSAMETACSRCDVAGKVGTCELKCVCYSSCGFWSCTQC